MAATHPYKVYGNGGEYLAAVKDLSIGAILVSGLGPGTTIRVGHRRAGTVWTEGQDGNAGDSYDHVVEVGEARMTEMLHRIHSSKLHQQQRAEAARSAAEAGHQKHLEQLRQAPVQRLPQNNGGK